MRALNNIVDKVITRLGKSNDSEIVTATLAAFKLIFIPFATMSDKKSTKEQKIYATTRDFLTEGVALAGYIGITKAVKNNLTGPICSKYYKYKAKELKDNLSADDFKFLSSIDKKELKNHAMNDFLESSAKIFTSSQKDNMGRLEEIVKAFPDKLQNPKELYLNTKKTISHLCVCTLALTLIPFITNKILEILSKTDIDKKFKPHETNKNNYTVLKPVNFKQYMQSTRIGGQNVLNY